MKYSFRIAVAFFLGVLVFSTAAGAQFLDPSWTWQTIETPHFRIHFHENSAGAAQLTAVAAEEAYEWWGEKLDYYPAEKVEVILADVQDGPNGFANLVPNNYFVNFTAYAGFAGGFANSESNSWEEVVTFHEYGHIADLDYVTGISETFRKIFGRVIIPGVQEPTLLVEGIPTYGEYLIRDHSRANEPRVEMMLRAMVLENNFPTYQEASFYYNRSEWPFPGTISHDFGPWFIRYLEDTYGEDTYMKLKQYQASDPLWAIGSVAGAVLGIGQFGAVSGDFNSIYKKATGKAMPELWTEFKAWLRADFNEQIQEIEAAGITPSRQLSQLSYFSTNALFSPDGEWVYYTHGGSPGRFGGMRKIRVDGTDDQAVMSGGFGDFAFTPDGTRLVYSKFGVQNKVLFQRDLYYYDLETGTETRLTDGERPFALAVTPDGNSVIYARYNLGEETPSISSVNIETGEITPIKAFTPDWAVEDLTLSPDGSTLALAIYRRGGYMDIYTMPASGGDLTDVTQDRGTDSWPRFSPDGQYLFFGSDRTGVYNLYAYEMGADTLYQVSNVLTGAQAPAISPSTDHEIAFTGYSSEGYDVHIMRYEPSTWTQVDNPKDPIPEWDGWPTTDYEITPYNPLPALMPKLWIPSFGGGQIGASTFGADALFTHNYNLAGGWDLNANKPFVNFSYFNSGMMPNFGLSAGLNANGNFVGVNASYPLIVGINHNQNISVGYQRSDFDGVSQTYSATWSMNDNRGLDLMGRSINLSITGLMTQNENFGTVNKGIASLTKAKSLPFGAGHSLNFRFVGGMSDAETPELGFSVGGLDGQFMVRGIGQGVAAGQNAFSTSLEYRFPIAQIEKGLSLWPIFIDDLNGDVFVDIGYAGLDPAPQYFEDLQIGYGFEARLSMNLLSYFGGPVFRFGIAQGLGQSSPELYISGGTAF